MTDKYMEKKETHTMRLMVDELKDRTISVLYHSSLVLFTHFHPGSLYNSGYC